MMPKDRSGTGDLTSVRRKKEQLFEQAVSALG